MPPSGQWTSPDYAKIGSITNTVAIGSSSATFIPFDPNAIVEGNPAQWYNPLMFTMRPMVTTEGGATVCTSLACTASTAYGTLGNSSRGLLRGPGLGKVDFSVNKDAALPLLGEPGKLTFRAEIFNIVQAIAGSAQHPAGFISPNPLWRKFGSFFFDKVAQ